MGGGVDGCGWGEFEAYSGVGGEGSGVEEEGVRGWGWGMVMGVVTFLLFVGHGLGAGVGLCFVGGWWVWRWLVLLGSNGGGGGLLAEVGWDFVLGPGWKDGLSRVGGPGVGTRGRSFSRAQGLAHFYEYCRLHLTSTIN